jgi:hypothetical protein
MKRISASAKSLLNSIQNQGRASHYFVVSPGSSSLKVKPRCHQAGWTVIAHHREDTPTTSSDPQCPGYWLVVHDECDYFDAMPTTNGSPLLALCVLNITEERCVLLPTILTPSRRLTKARWTKVQSNRSLPEVCRKKVLSQRLTKARTEKRSKPKANESEADNNNSDKNRLHEDPHQSGPSNFTRGQGPSGFSSVIESHSTTLPKSLISLPTQEKKKI